MLLFVFLDAGGVEGALGRRGGEGVAARGGGALEDKTRWWRVEPRSRLVLYLYMCRLSGPSRPDDTRPEGAGSEVTAPGLNGLEWSKVETAIDARVLAPETCRQFFIEIDQTECCRLVAVMTKVAKRDGDSKETGLRVAAPWTVIG